MLSNKLRIKNGVKIYFNKILVAYENILIADFQIICIRNKY